MAKLPSVFVTVFLVQCEKDLNTTRYTNTTGYTQYNEHKKEITTMFDDEKPEPPHPPGLRERKRKRVRIIVKGYMRPDGSSYHVVIPKQIREMMQLEGGEYFLMAASPRRDEIRLRRVDFFNDEDEGSAPVKK
jgi:hypothetical protein